MAEDSESTVHRWEVQPAGRGHYKLGVANVNLATVYLASDTRLVLAAE